ncbi:MAG: transposase [Lachnospiraceae bacterium]|nr:transposase [Lachnospiraceae bacterium]
MPRKAREKAKSGIYHVMLRGINHQQIFEEEDDYQVFLRILRKCKRVSGFKLLAYCLMGNHIHLLIKENEERLELILKRIGVRFVRWYNQKYQRSGHLFQDRFKSEVVDDERYLITVIAYIHQNPVKAGICMNPEEYRYSSYREYQKYHSLVDMDYVESIISRETIVSYTKAIVDKQCLEIGEKTVFGVTDLKAKEMIIDIAGLDDTTELKEIEKCKRQRIIKSLNVHGLTMRQISRLTGISYYTVRKAIVG